MPDKESTSEPDHPMESESAQVPGNEASDPETRVEDSNNNGASIVLGQLGLLHIIRVWCDGCYDMVHFGHMNNLRQAKAKGHYLIVGLHSDADIELHKGARPVFTQAERVIMVRAIKWVDEVVLDVPYVTTVEILDKYGCDFCCHGNDITTTAAGIDTYLLVKDAGRYKEVERTQGVSTSASIARMLKCVDSFLSIATEAEAGGGGDTNFLNGDSEHPAWKKTPFICTISKLRQAAADGPNFPNPIPKDAKVVYVAGVFDILHPGHLKFLEEASKLGTHVIVGVYDNATASKLDGPHRPIMDVNQRAYSLLGLKYVSDVVIGAPYLVTEELLDHLNVSVVAHGKKTKVSPCPFTGLDPHQKAKGRGIYEEIDSGYHLTTDDVIRRITSDSSAYKKRNEEKELKEAAEAAARASANS